MRLPHGPASFFGLSLLVLAGAALASFCSCISLASPPGQTSNQSAEEDLFQSTNLIRISIEITEEGLQTLRRSQARRNQIKPQAQASVTEGRRVYTNVIAQLKGFTTFQPIDGLPSLTLNFHKLAPQQKFHGLRKISLNNSLQDPTRLHEKLARELFAAAGVPVPRSDHALVTLNGRELGLYVLTEGYDKQFLGRHFKRTDGNLYEGGVLQDIDQPLKLCSGKNPTDHTGVQRLISASREPDPVKRLHALEAALDMDRFRSMVAMETILCHSDSYSMNRNNYRLYHDPSTDKIVFMPHGMDRVLGTHRSSLDLRIVPPLLGLVARAVLSTPEGRRCHVERVGVLFTNLFQPDRLCRRVHEIDAKIAHEKTNRSVERRFDGQSGQGHAQDAGDLCDRIWERGAELKMQLAELPDILSPTPSPEFDRGGSARIDGWKPKRRAGQPEIPHETDDHDGKQVLHLWTSNGRMIASLRSQVSLPAGSYRLAGPIKIASSAGAANFVSAGILRYSGTRFGLERHRLDWREINFSFQISEALAPEEIELVCDIRDDSSEIWFDASSLRLIQEAK
jgi:spore coat protein H